MEQDNATSNNYHCMPSSGYTESYMSVMLILAQK